MEQRELPKWNPTSYHGDLLSTYEADQAKLEKKSLLPLGVKPLQEKPFMRTGRVGGEFSHTIGSII